LIREDFYDGDHVNMDIQAFLSGTTPVTFDEIDKFMEINELLSTGSLVDHQVTKQVAFTNSGDSDKEPYEEEFEDQLACDQGIGLAEILPKGSNIVGHHYVYNSEDATWSANGKTLMYIIRRGPARENALTEEWESEKLELEATGLPDLNDIIIKYNTDNGIDLDEDSIESSVELTIDDNIVTLVSVSISSINSNVEYPETKVMADTDKGHLATLWEIEICDLNITVALGKENKTYKDDGIIYYPIYLVGKNNKVSHRIGVYEISREIFESSIYLDEDGDIDILQLDPPLLWTFVNADFLKKHGIYKDSVELLE